MIGVMMQIALCFLMNFIMAARIGEGKKNLPHRCDTEDW